MSRPLTAWIEGIGFLAPGLPDWPTARAVLRGEMPLTAAPSVLPAPSILPPAERRRADLGRWTANLMPLAEALHVLLGLLRDSGAPQRVVALGGQFQQSLPSGRAYHLMRVRLEEGSPLVPEISGHRLMAMVRLMQPEADGRLRPSSNDTEFELTLCS